MLDIKDDIFKAYDIRGKYPDEVNKEIAYRVGGAVARYLKGEIVIGYDGRESSPELAKAVIKGLKENGSRVINIGYSTTPMFYFAVNYLKKSGGIMVTASHNPNDMNGFKIVDENVISVFPKDIKELVFEEPQKTGNAEVTRYDIEEEYLEYLIQKSGIKKNEIDLEVSLKAEDKSLEFAEKILNNIGVKVSQNSDLVFEFDKDGDRLKVANIRSDYLLGLLVKEELNKFHIFKPKFIYDLMFSKSIPEFIEEQGGRAIRSRIGHAFIKIGMHQHKAKIGGEFSGHFYFKNMFYSEDSLMAMLRIIDIAKKGNLVEQTKIFQKYYHSGEMNIKIEGDRHIVIDKLADKYNDGEIDRLDGLTVEYSNWWFNVRSSNTEQLLRFVVESDSETIMMEKVEEIKKAIQFVE